MKHLAISFIMAFALAGALQAAARKAVVVQTTLGDIRIELYDETPAHRDNFLKLARSHFYDSLLFHRVVRNFVVQAGDPGSKRAEPGQMLGGGTLDYRIPAEIRLPRLYHKRGAVAMAARLTRLTPGASRMPASFISYGASAIPRPSSTSSASALTRWAAGLQ